MALVEQATGWQDDAACRDHPYPDVFFAPSKAEQRAAARMVCDRCPVRSECLDYAIRAREAHGVWGGVTEDDLRSLTRRKGHR